MASTIDVLAIKVQSDGITKASRELDNLGKSADTTEKKILKLIDTVDKMVSKFATSVSGTKAMTDALAVVNRTTQASDSAMKALTGSIAKLSAEVANLNARMQNGAAGITSHTVTIRHNTAAMTDAHAAARGLTGSLGALWLTYGNVAPLAAGAAIGASLKQIITIGADVENTLEAIRLKTGATIDEMQRLNQVVTDLGKGIYGPQEVAKALEVLSLAGLKATDAANAVGAALNLATSGGTTIEKSAEALVTIGTAVGATAQEYDYLADAIQKTANISLASVDSIAESVKRASVVNKLYGASFEDILTQTAALAQLGIKNTAAGTAITNFYANARAETEKAKKAVDALGFSFQDSAGKVKPLVQAFTEYDAALKKFDTNSQKNLITAQFGERALRDVQAVLSLLNQAAESTERLADGTLKYKNRLEEVSAEVSKSAGTAALVAAEQALTTTNQFKTLSNTLQTAFSDAFTAIAPMINNILKSLQQLFASPEFTNGVKNLAQGFASLAETLVSNIKPIGMIVEGFLAVAAATAGGALFTKLIPSIVGLITVTTGLATSMTSLGAAANIGAAGITAVSTATKFLPGVGIVLGLLSAAYALYSLHADKATKSTKEFAEETSKAASGRATDFIKNLDDQIDRLKKVNAELDKGKDLAKATADAADQQALAKQRAMFKEAEMAAQLNVQEAQRKFTSKAIRDYTFDRKGSSEARELLAAQNALNTAKKATVDFEDAAIKRTKEVTRLVEEQKNKMDARNKAADIAAQGSAGTKTFGGSEDKSGKKALTFLEEEQRTILTSTAAYKAKTAALLESYETGSKVAAESAESAILVNKQLGKYSSDQAFQAQLQLAREEDLAKANYDKAKQFTELGIKLKGIVEAENAYQIAVAKGEDGGGKYTREAEALSKFLGLTKEQTAAFIDLAKASDEINKTLDTRKKLESGTASATARADQLMEQAKAMSEYGSKAKSTALDLAKAKVAEMDLNDAASITIANNYLKAASYETVAKALVNITRIGEQSAEEEIKAQSDSLLLFADSEKKKIEIKADAAKKIIALNLAQAKAAAESGDDKAVKAYEKAYSESLKAIAQIDKTTKTKMHNVELEDWKKTVNSIVDTGLAGFDHIFDKGTSIWKSLTSSIKDMFKKTVIDYIKKEFAKPFLLNIVSSVSGSLGMTGLADTAKAMLGGEKASGSGSATSLVSAASNIYKAVSGGFASLTHGVTEAVQSGLNLLGPGSGFYSPAASGLPASGLASGAGAAAGALAGIAGGVFGGRAISGGYSALGGSGNSAVNIGTAIGTAILPGIGSLVGGLIGGAVNRLFGMKAKETTSQGIRGTLSDEGLSGSGYTNWKQKGGLFRSDKSGTDLSAIPTDISNSLTTGFESLKMVTEGFAKTVGAGSNALEGFTKSFDIAFGSDATKNQEAVTKFFTDLGDELATKLVPNIKDFSLQGETASVTLERLSNIFGATNQVAEILGKSVEQMFGGKGLDTAKARENLVNLAGGINELANKTTAYVSAIYTDSQKLEPVQKALANAFKELNVAAPTTKEGFKALVDSLNVTDAAQAKLFNSLLDLAPAFAQIIDATDALKESQEQAAEDAKAAAEQAAKDARQAAEKLISDRLSIQMKIATLEKDEIAIKNILNQQREIEINALDATLQPLQKRLNILTDEADLAEKVSRANEAALAITKSKLSLELQIADYDKESVFYTKVLAEQRKIELAAMDASLRPLQERLYAIEDEKKLTELANRAAEDAKNLAKNRLSMELEIAEYDKESIFYGKVLAVQRRMELEAMDASLRPLKERLYAIEDEKKAYEKAVNASEAALQKLSDAVEKQKEGINKYFDAQIEAEKKRAKEFTESTKKQLKAAEDSVQAVKTIFDAIKDAISSTVVESYQLDLSRRQAAQSLIRQAAASGADITKVAGLQDALKDISKPSEQFFSTFEDYARDQALTANNLNSLKDNAQTQLDLGQLTIDRLNATIEAIQISSDANILALETQRDIQLEAANALYENAKQQLDILKGIDVSILSVADALKLFSGSLGDIAAAPAPSAAQTAVSSGTSIEDQVKGLYQTYLGRAPDAEGYAWWLNAAKNGASLANMAQGFISSPEYQSLHKLDVGTNFVPEDMPAMVHKGERVIPAADNTEIMRRIDGDSQAQYMDSVKAEIASLKSVIMSGDTANVQMTKELLKIYRKWDQDGMPEIRDVDAIAG